MFEKNTEKKEMTRSRVKKQKQERCDGDIDKKDTVQKRDGAVAEKNAAERSALSVSEKHVR